MATASFALPAHAFGLDVHPSRPLIAVGLITGQLKLYDHSEATRKTREIRQAASARPHKGSCRAVRFSADGGGVFSTGSDGSLQLRDLASNKPAWRKREAHGAESSINALCLLGERGVATGDDEGSLAMWDLRSRKKALSFRENTEYVADLLYTEARGGHTLCAA